MSVLTFGLVKDAVANTAADHGKLKLIQLKFLVTHRIAFNRGHFSRFDIHEFVPCLRLI